MEVKIKNLFGYRNYDLKLNNKVNILIGENGSGKSTILKMLICIFNNDFVELSKIPFEEINVKLPVKKDNELYEVKDGKKNKIDSVEFNIKSSDLTQLEYTKDAKFRIIFKKFLEEYAFENDYINENFAFEKFLKELEKKVNSEKSGIIIEVKDDYIVDDAKYFLNLLINLDDLNIDRFLEIYPLESQLLLPFLLNDIVYGSRMYLFYFYMFYLLKNVEDKHKPSPETFIHLTGGYLTKFDSIFNYTYFYNDICQFPLNFIFNDINLTNGYYYFDNETIRMTLIETEITDKNLNQKLKILHNTFNKGLILTKLICEKADLDDYVIYTEDKKYDIDLMSKQSYIKLIKDICDINMLEGLGEEYISGNYIPSLCYLSIDEIEPNELAKYIEVMRIIKKFKEKYEFPKEEKTNEKEFYDFWNKTRCGSHIKGLGEKEFTREDYILELSDDPINSIVSKKRYFNEKSIKFGIFKVHKIMSNIMKLDIMSYFDSVEVKNFNSLFNKYLPNKKHEFGYNENGKIEINIYDKKTGKVINESMLSSGEYKMYRLIKYMTLDKQQYIKLLDEPELSLSMHWQRFLIDDLLSNTNSNKIIIATQSTSLVNEEQTKYLVEVKYNEE